MRCLWKGKHMGFAMIWNLNDRMHYIFQENPIKKFPNFLCGVYNTNPSHDPSCLCFLLTNARPLSNVDLWKKQKQVINYLHPSRIIIQFNLDKLMNNFAMLLCRFNKFIKYTGGVLHFVFSQKINISHTCMSLHERKKITVLIHCIYIWDDSQDL